LSWSADGKRILVQRGWRAVALLETENGREREFLRDDRFPIVEARFSPDGKWVAFTLAARPHSQIFVVPVDAPEQRTEVTAGIAGAGSPAWAADGGQLYFLTECQGFRCIWARRLDAHRKPQGEPFPIRHFHHARHLLSGIDPQNVGLVAARDKLVFGMFETVGNVWSLPSLPRP
jgi:dipeptidyl aminopeptidase/acylaminoacyl peptidase